MGDVWQFVVELKDFKPRIWRRFQIKSGSKLQDFCYAVMSMFNCLGIHLHQLIVNEGGFETFYLTHQECVDEDNAFVDYLKTSGAEGLYNASSKSRAMDNIAVCDIFKQENDVAVLQYDFGDEWDFKIKLEKTAPKVGLDKDAFAIVLKGAGYGIIEDCGGTWGLAEICNALMSGEPTENFDTIEEMDEWLSHVLPDLDELKNNGFDFFDIETINEDIADLQYLREFYTADFFE